MSGEPTVTHRILLDLDRTGAVRDELVAPSTPLRRVVADAAERILLTKAARTVSWLKAGDDRMAVITTEELQALVRPVAELLSSRT